MERHLKTLLALFALLALTVLAAYSNLGVFNTPVAMLISLAKAVLIALFFMRLRQQSPISRLFAGAGVVWFGILVALSLADYLTR